MNWFNRYPDLAYWLLRLIIGLMFACHGGQSLSAQEYKDFGKDRLNNSPRHGEWVDIKSGDRTIKAFVVYPERKDKAPAVLVIQEIFGLTDWLRSMCDELAENGVIAIAPDFLNGQKFEDADSASKAISAVTQDQVKAVLDATADYALKIPACNGTLAVAGFVGAGMGFAYANENPKLKAAYSFYGTAPDEASKVANIRADFVGAGDGRLLTQMKIQNSKRHIHFTELLRVKRPKSRTSRVPFTDFTVRTTNA